MDVLSVSCLLVIFCLLVLLILLSNYDNIHGRTLNQPLRVLCSLHPNYCPFYLLHVVYFVCASKLN